MDRHKKPIVFIGSSTEGLNIARTAEELLYADASIHLWTADTFKPGTYPIDDLLLESEASDYALFVLGPDDLSLSRANERRAPRDNVIFEAGLFMGRLGRLRTFLLFDRDDDMKLPSDLTGLTLLPYSHHHYMESPKGALGPAMNQVRGALLQKARFEELAFLKAYLKFIDPPISLTDTYCKILSRHIDQIRKDIAELEAKGDWESMLQVKIRLREYFEYSGMYRYGAECGRRFVVALKELGEDYESAWTRVKQVGYLSILCGDHSQGRAELLAVLDDLEGFSGADASRTVLRFYCNRYLGISFQREELPGHLDEAKKRFDEAQRCVDALNNEDVKKPLQARLLANYGNLALDSGAADQALKSYEGSLALFIEIKDSEHIGIANLQLAQAIISGAGRLTDASAHLDSAESLFLELGCVELQGRVAEQRALLHEALANRAVGEEPKMQLVRVAVESANRAKRLYKQVDSQKRLGAIEATLQALRRRFPPPAASATSAG